MPLRLSCHPKKGSQAKASGAEKLLCYNKNPTQTGGEASGSRRGHFKK